MTSGVGRGRRGIRRKNLDFSSRTSDHSMNTRAREQNKETATERWRCARYRYSAPIVVRRADGTEVRGVSLEISTGGISAMFGASFEAGERVELEPVGGGAVAAVVRRTFGKLCGFEFLSLSREQAEKITQMCQMLPLFRSRTLERWPCELLLAPSPSQETAVTQ